jgi:hypothetical protein
MARVIGGIGTSHSPRLAHAYDSGLQNDPAWAPIFGGYEPAKQWLKCAAPDLMILIYNDHVNQFFFDAYPTFALGVGESHGQPTRAGASATCPMYLATPISPGTSHGR